MKNKLRNYILFGIFSLLAASSIFMTIETATSGVEIAELEKKEAELIKKKSEMEESLVKTLSLGELHQRSGDLGFSKPLELVYITPAETVAKLTQ